MPYGQGPTRYGVRKGVSPVRKRVATVRNDAIEVRKGYLWFRTRMLTEERVARRGSRRGVWAQLSVSSFRLEF